MLERLGPEFTILRETPIEDIRHAAGPCVAEGIRRLRAGEVERQPGYDGVYGMIGLLTPAERGDVPGPGEPLWESGAPARTGRPRRRSAGPKGSGQTNGSSPRRRKRSTRDQRAAVEAQAPTVAVVAGPGAGKTKTLVSRIAWLVEQGARPGTITAVTFTNKAAAELRERLEARLGKRRARAMTIGTFHSICLTLLRGELGVRRLADPYEQRRWPRPCWPGWGGRTVRGNCSRRSPGQKPAAGRLRKRR